MNISDRGIKHVCSECQCKYYDLRGEIVACPKCGSKPIPVKARKAGNAPKAAGRTKQWRFP